MLITLAAHQADLAAEASRCVQRGMRGVCGVLNVKNAAQSLNHVQKHTLVQKQPIFVMLNTQRTFGVKMASL